MAYKITKNKLKNGDTIYYINQVSRVPGTKNKHKQVMVEKFSANELILEGKDPESYVNAKMNEYKEAALEEVKSLTYTVDLTKNHSHIHRYSNYFSYICPVKTLID